MLHFRTVHNDQSYQRLRIQIIHAPYVFKQFAREINRGRELFLNFSRGCANYSKFCGARNYSRACNNRVIRVYKPTTVHAVFAPFSMSEYWDNINILVQVTCCRLCGVNTFSELKIIDSPLSLLAKFSPNHFCNIIINHLPEHSSNMYQGAVNRIIIT